MEALLLVDIQNDYFRGGRFPLAGMKKAACRAREILEAFRKEQKTIIHIQHISLKKDATFFLPETSGSKIHSLVQPLDGETVFIKHFPNSFRDTGLADFLKAQNITCIHIIGAMTNMCIDTTVRAGFDLGYSMIIHQNACAARGLLGTRIIHRISIKTLGSVFAEIR